MDILIEQNVPLPAEETQYSKIDKMEIGDSFLFPSQKRRSMASFISTEFHATSNKRFKISTKDQPKGKARLWRKEDKN
ncbi:hypothetical protein DIU36_24755 [Mucilaginibacter rubeus]|nr:hypothetical protein DIU36_24755 [Mucilaginibacter rubeus]